MPAASRRLATVQTPTAHSRRKNENGKDTKQGRTEGRTEVSGQDVNPVEEALSRWAVLIT